MTPFTPEEWPSKAQFFHIVDRILFPSSHSSTLARLAIEHIFVVE
jgi:hypothetical protein